MSRTDVHAPYWVKALDPGWRDHFTEKHDHSSGVCDLDTYQRVMVTTGGGWVRTRCRIDPASRGRNVHCGCATCSGRAWARSRHHGERTAWRSERGRLLADPWADMPRLHRARW